MKKPILILGAAFILFSNPSILSASDTLEGNDRWTDPKTGITYQKYDKHEYTKSEEEDWNFLNESSSEEGNDTFLSKKLRDVLTDTTKDIVQSEMTVAKQLSTLPKTGSTASVSKKTDFFENQIQKQTPKSPKTDGKPATTSTIPVVAKFLDQFSKKT